MSLTEFFTSSSVTSTTVQCSSSEGRGSSPFLVTQGCDCRAEGREGQGHRRQTSASEGPRHPTSSRLEGPKPKTPNPNPIHRCPQCKAPQKGKLRPVFCGPAQPSTSGFPTLMSGTPILVSGFLSSIFRIKSLSSSLTFGLKKGKEGDEGETADGPLLPTSAFHPAPGFPDQCTPGQRHRRPPFSESGRDTPKGTRVEGEISRTSVWISFSPEYEVKHSPSGGRGHRHKRGPMGAGHPLGGRGGKDNARRVILWDLQEAFAPTHYLIFSSAWEAAREDTI